MFDNSWRVVLTLVGAVALGACSLLGNPDPLAGFSWQVASPQEEVVNGIEVTGLREEIFVLGGLLTPTKCYELEADFDESGRRLTLRVDARSTNSPNCDDDVGRYRYTAVIQGIDPGAYDLRVIHAVANGETRQFEDEVLVR